MAARKPIQRPDSSNPTPTIDRLDSWKSVAQYLRRDIRTAQRWEKHDALPVHRLPNSKRGAVYAFKSEIDQWWESDHRRAEAAASTSEPLQDARASRHISYLRPAIYILLLAVIMVASPEIKHLLLQVSRPRLDPRRGHTTLVVLPFENLSGDTPDDLFAEGLAKTLAHGIGDDRHVQIITVSSDIPYPPADKTLSDMALGLHSQALIRGSVQYSGQRFSASVELIDGANGLRIWARQYQQSGPDLLSCEKAVIPKVAVELRTAIAPVLGRRMADSGSFPSSQDSESPATN